jgi:predicted MFS family arabinose efflux permease
MRRTMLTLLCLEGAVLSFNVAASGLAALLYGPLVRAVNAKKVEVICFLLFCASNMLAACAPDMRVFLAARVCMGVSGASVIPLALILIAQRAPRERRGTLVGIFFGATFVASLAGLLLSGIVYWRMLYLIPALFGIVVWVHLLIYLEDVPPPTDRIEQRYAHALSDMRVRWIYVYIFVISMLFHMVQPWLSVLFATRDRFDQCTISMLIMLTSFTGIFGEMIGGVLADRIGRIRTLTFGIALMAVAVFFLIPAPPLFAVALLMIAWGLGWTFNHAGLSTILTDVPQKFLHESASLNSGVRFLAGGLGSLAGGFMLRQGASFHLAATGFGLLAIALSGKYLQSALVKE